MCAGAGLGEYTLGGGLGQARVCVWGGTRAGMGWGAQTDANLGNGVTFQRLLSLATPCKDSVN